MISLPSCRAWWPAVGPRLDRGVRRRFWRTEHETTISTFAGRCHRCWPDRDANKPRRARSLGATPTERTGSAGKRCAALCGAFMDRLPGAARRRVAPLCTRIERDMFKRAVLGVRAACQTADCAGIFAHLGVNRRPSLQGTHQSTRMTPHPERQGHGGRRNTTMRQLGHLRRLTFELTGHQRRDARPGLAKMYRVPPDRAWWPAVGAPVERGVRPHCSARRRNSSSSQCDKLFVPAIFFSAATPSLYSSIESLRVQSYWMPARSRIIPSIGQCTGS
jgi:hypothetical protein